LSPAFETGGGSSEPPPPAGHTGLARIVAGLVQAWALLGGVVTLGLSVMVAASAASNILTGRPFAADHELVKHFIAVAIFMFLPYCQLTGANVTVDVFTARMGARAKAAMALVSSLIAAAFAVLLLKQMSQGMMSYLQYPEVTPVLRLPLWTAFPPILASLLLLLLAALFTMKDAWGAFSRAGGRPGVTES
jgi:TRAP-type C4-dicarboxylate transport system permease small subunit